MKAIVYDRYGPPDVQRLEDVERPVPKDDEVLVKIHATTVNRLDCATREANRRGGLLVTLISRLISGISRPKQRILGSEFAGEVEAVGAAVKEFAVGDPVFGASGLRFGAHAEFMCMKEGHPFPQGDHRGGEVQGSHRSLLSPGASDRRNEVRRNGAEDRKRRPYG